MLLLLAEGCVVWKQWKRGWTRYKELHKHVVNAALEAKPSALIPAHSTIESNTDAQLSMMLSISALRD
jgi:hypothetical protein